MKTVKNIIKLKKIRLFLLLTLALVTLSGTVLSVSAYDWIRPTGIAAVGKKKMSMSVGEERKLRVRMNPLHADDDFLYWKILSGKKVVRFDDYDRNDDSMDIVALKAGTAKVCCYINGKPATKVTFTITVKKASQKTGSIIAKGDADRYVELYDDFDLEVRKRTSVSDRCLKWEIADRSILDFEDRYETTGDDVEFYAKKTGTTTVTCTNTLTKDKVHFTVRVVTRYDEYDRHADFWDD